MHMLLYIQKIYHFNALLKSWDEWRSSLCRRWRKQRNISCAL